MRTNFDYVDVHFRLPMFSHRNTKVDIVTFFIFVLGVIMTALAREKTLVNRANIKKSQCLG
jgi:hypothetical protein